MYYNRYKTVMIRQTDFSNFGADWTVFLTEIWHLTVATLDCSSTSFNSWLHFGYTGRSSVWLFVEPMKPLGISWRRKGVYSEGVHLSTDHLTPYIIRPVEAFYTYCKAEL
jgi:hypothetical protein